MSEILNVLEKPHSDENISKKEYHSYSPYLQSFKPNDEIRITIQNQDLYVLPHESYINVTGTITLSTNTTTAVQDLAKLKNNCLAHLFDEIRYEINGVEIDRTRYVGLTTTLKNYASLNSQESKMLENSGWFEGLDKVLQKDSFNFSIPLKCLLGFAEDFNKILINCKHELILLMSKTMENSFYSDIGAAKFKLTINNIIWKIPHISLNDQAKLQMLNIIKSGNSLPISFRSWDCYTNPSLVDGTHHVWNVKLSANRERPRFAIIAFEENGKLITNNLANLKVHLNSESYPYADLNLKFDQDHFATLYDMYAKFQQSYYMRESHPLLTSTEFKNKAPIAIIDLSYQNETVKTGPIDVKVSIELSAASGRNTKAYCLLIHDRLVEYSPLTGLVHKIV